MKVENRADGWHVLDDHGRDIGPIKTLRELEETLDRLENLKRVASEAPQENAAPTPLPKLSSS